MYVECSLSLSLCHSEPINKKSHLSQHTMAMRPVLKVYFKSLVFFSFRVPLCPLASWDYSWRTVLSPFHRGSHLRAHPNRGAMKHGHFIWFTQPLYGENVLGPFTSLAAVRSWSIQCSRKCDINLESDYFWLFHVYQWNEMSWNFSL